MGYFATKSKISSLVNVNFFKKFINIKLTIIIIVIYILYILQLKNINTDTNLRNDIPEKLLPYLNKENYNNNSLGSIELTRNIKSDFNTHFPMYNSSIVTTLTVWQYWWWMSFILIIVLFNKVLLKIFFENTLKIKPKIHTSIKSNGRWGDTVASLFPIFWCSNILVNSNLILKIIENHSESGLFTLRVRGKQWYWVYKFSVNLKNDLMNNGIIIGRNNKINITYRLKKKNIPFIKNKKTFFKKIKLLNKKNNKTIYKFNKLNIIKVLNNQNYKNIIINNNIKLNKYFNKKINIYNIIETKLIFKTNKLFYKINKSKLILCKSELKFSNNNNLFIIKKTQFNSYRPYNRHFFTIQQQPKTNWKFFKKNLIVTYDSHNTNINNIYKTKKIIPLNNLQKKNTSSKLRLISSRNTLVLPTETNITVITNSFDVVHSWFIPGLGLKFDCVPGRSTHYTLRLNKPGIYIGHCAEVCGRFHHHMPIKIIAIPFNQYIYYYNMYYSIN